MSVLPFLQTETLRPYSSVSRGDRIYHLPGSDSYDITVIDERSGERWFCSEAEARAAGWRAANPRTTR